MLVLSAPAHSSSYAPLSLLQVSEASPLVLEGRVVSVGEDEAVFEVAKVMKGTTEAERLRLPVLRTPGLRIPPYTVGEQAVVFLADKAVNPSMQVRLISPMGGRVILKPGRQAADRFAVQEILALASLGDTHERELAMIEAATADNQLIRDEGLSFLRIRLPYSDHRDDCAPALTALLTHADTAIAAASASGLQFAKYEPSIAPLIDATRQSDTNLVRAASLALGKFDTAESAAALIALLDHVDPRMRSRAAIDLSMSRRPEVKQALLAALDDPDTHTRAIVTGRFFQWMRNDDADDVVPRLVEMLADPAIEVRAAAADSLSESRDARIVPPLLAVLREPDLDARIAGRVFGTLYSLRSKAGPAAAELIDPEMALYLDLLKRVPEVGFQLVGLLDLIGGQPAQEALQWAAESHPQQRVREHAARLEK